MSLFGSTRKLGAPAFAVIIGVLLVVSCAAEAEEEGADTQSVSSVLASIWDAIKAQLHGPKQWPNALVATVFGMLLLADGMLVFKWVVLGAVFILAAILARNELVALWGLGGAESHRIRTFVGLEAGACAAFAAHQGLRGVMAALGLMLGAFIGYGLENSVMLHFQPDFPKNQWAVVVWYSIFIIGTAALVFKNKHDRVLAIITPILGGALVSSAACWGMTSLAVKGKLPVVYTMFPSLQEGQGGGAWLDFLELLLFKVAPDVGIFAGSDYNPAVFGKKWRLDRICGVFLWAILALVGAKVQSKRMRKAAKKTGLTEPLVK